MNLYGEVIGVNTMMVSTGFGFAIPGSHCKNFVTLAMNSNRPGGVTGGMRQAENYPLSKPGGTSKYMGVVMGSLTPQMVFENRMNNPDYIVHPSSGVVIHLVHNSSPAQK